MTLILLAIFLALQIVDALTTLHDINRGKTEANSPMRKLMARIGTVPALVVAKGFAAAVAALIALYTQPYAPYGLVILCGLYGWAAVNNIRAGQRS